MSKDLQQEGSERISMAAEQNYHRDFVDVARGNFWSNSGQVGAPPGHADGMTAWLQIDLGLRFPVHSIQITPVFEPDWTDLSGYLVTFSDDGEVWSPPGVIVQTGNGDPSPLILINPGEACWTRYVRLSTEGLKALDQGEVNIWSERAVFDLIVLRRTIDVDFDIVSEQPGLDVYRGYRLRSNASQTGLSLIGVDLYENGAFGNFIIQCLLAIGICRALRLKYIKLSVMDRSEVLDLVHPRDIGGITFIPATDALPTDGYFLSGMFFDVKIQKLAGDLDQKESRRIINNYIRPLFNRLPTKILAKPDDQLLIHIRSGDIFSTWVAPHYPQPPLAFYKLVIQRLLAEHQISSVKLVFENRLNPVISELEAYISQIGIPLTTQSGTLAEDVEALVNGRFLVFGLGTFGPGVCHLSEYVEQVFFFASGWPQHFRGIPTIGKIIEVIDLVGGYIKVGEWDNSAKNRQLMIDYPIENLVFDDHVL